MTPIPEDLVQRAAEIVIAQQRATPSMLERLLRVVMCLPLNEPTDGDASRTE